MDIPITNWIWTPNWNAEDAAQPRLVLFRKCFIWNPGADATVRVSADTRYKLYLNSQLIEIGPDKGDREIWYADTLDLTDHLVPGENTVCAEVLRYPLSREAGNHSLFRTETPGFFLSGAMVETNGNWKCHVNRKVRFVAEESGFAPLIIHENAEGDEALLGWMEKGYNDESWDYALPYPAFQIHQAISPGNLTPRRIPFLYRRDHSFALFESGREDSETWQALLCGKGSLCIPPHTTVHVVLDAKEEMTAYLHLAFAGGAGSCVELLEAECYVQPERDPLLGRIVKGHRSDSKRGHLEGYTDRYTVGGFGSENVPECYEPFWYRTFRFIGITIQTQDKPLTLMRLDYAETGYPLEVRTKVHTSDPSLSDIWDISLRTLRRCMHETYEDCPFYEQLQYIMDTRAQILFTYSVAADDRLARKAIDDFARSQRSDGLLNCCYPNMNPNVIPGFSLYYILIVHDHMMYFGDQALVRRYLPVIDRILNFFDENLTAQGLVGKVGGILLREKYWSFIDWSPEWAQTVGMPPAGLSGPITMESLLYILGLQHAAELADYIERHDTATEYRRRAETVQTAVLTYCVRADGMLSDGPGSQDASQQSQVFGILTGTLNQERGRQNLLRTLTEPGFAQCQVAMNYYLFRAMEQTGLYEYTDHCWDLWRAMLAMGCTTTIENNVLPRSECHAWGALALYELPSSILGVRPTAPGYTSAEICPHTEYLTFAEGTICTPRGEITVRWDKRDDTVQLSVTTPEGISVRQRLPGQEP